MEYNQILFGDCLELMKDISEGQIDMILVDLPYGVTRAKWDTPLPLDRLWEQYERIIKPNGSIVFTATQPFSSLLVVSNLKHFRYDLIWRKNKSTGHLNAKRMPLRAHEHILVFYKKPPVYNPQKTYGHSPVHVYTKKPYGGEVYGNTNHTYRSGGNTDRYPKSVIDVPMVNMDSPERVHSVQKPVSLFEWLIKTYTNEGEVVLDSCIGSGTTAIAALKTNRRFIGMEIDLDIYKVAQKRLSKYVEGLWNLT